MGCCLSIARYPMAKCDPVTRRIANGEKTCTQSIYDLCPATITCFMNIVDRSFRCLWHFIIYLPLICLWTPIRVYFLECIFVYCKRGLAGFFYSCSKALCPCCGLCFGSLWHYKDKKFPTGHKSIGEWKSKSPSDIDAEIIWKRATELDNKSDHGATLFGDKIYPSDIAQGSLGDCWLLSAFASLAEWPGSIQRCFKTKEKTLNGKYKIRLFDARKKKARTITVDDMIPCSKETGQPIFTKPKDNALWVLLLEKAFAKFCGGYGNLSGGLSLWALQAMTGDEVGSFIYDQASKKWTKQKMVHIPDQANPRKFGLKPSAEQHDSNKMFSILEAYHLGGGLLAAGSIGSDDTENSSGIVKGHQYSVTKVQKVGSYRFLQLRNPWGHFEWTGDWSDKSALWDRHPDVASKLRKQDRDDGTFFMEMDDFVMFFDHMDVCKRSTGIKNLALDHREDEGCCGPTQGCIIGCLKYWCCCQGCYAICCARETDDETPKTPLCPFSCCHTVPCCMV